jgi:hypothetical protein
VFTVLPHFVLRYRKMPPQTAKKVLLATHGGLSLELCAVLFNVSPMSVYRLVGAFGRTCLVTLLTRCHLPLPDYFIVDEKHTHCNKERVYLPTIVCGRVIWHLSYTTAKSVEAFFDAYGKFRQAAVAYDPSYCAKGILTDGFSSTKKSLRLLFPEAKLANCFLHAIIKFPAQIKWVAKAVRRTLTLKLCQLFFAHKAKKTENNRSLAQRLRRFIQQVTLLAGKENGQRVKRWIGRKKDGWYALFDDPSIPKTSALIDQAENALARKLFMMKGFHHKEGNQESFLNGIAMLYNLIPYQRRAKNSGQCGIQVEGGKLPTDDWLLNLQILTSGGFV